MSRWAFYWHLGAGAFRHGWEAAHHAHMLLVLLGGVVLLVLAASLEGFMAAGVICVLVFVAFLILGLFEHAYQMHRKDHKAASEAQTEAAHVKQSVTTEIQKAAEGHEKERRELAG